MQFPHLFSPLEIRGRALKNRIFSTAHQTYLARDGKPSDDMVAYHEARAAGGAGLIIVEAAPAHATNRREGTLIDASGDACIPGYRAIATAVQRHGCLLFGQFTHGGRIGAYREGGRRTIPYSASAVPDERFHNMPRAMPVDLIRDVVDSFGKASARLAEAGLDGIEVAVSYALLPAQFLNPAINRRTDHYGGSDENRLRFLLEVLAAVREAVGGGLIVGIRISVDELEADGLDAETVLATCRRLDQMAAVDYVNTTIGSMAGLGGSVHVAPPMAMEPAYVAPKAAAIKAAVSVPVFVAGRINEPHVAERVLAAGQADMCAMTRAMIADAEMPAKALAGRIDDIRACVGCNQACIGHFHMGQPLSCIQNPVSGRERRLGKMKPAARPRRVLVAGGGPGGMKAAATAGQRGHHVVLCEAGPRLGGQVLLAQLLPGRAEFGGVVTNLERELEQAGVTVRRNTPVDGDLVTKEVADAVIVATGARPYRPSIEGEDEAHLVDAWQVLAGEANVGARVLVADWRGDWVGMGIAEKLARDGCHVRLAVNGTHAGHDLQPYVRDHWVGVLHGLGVEVIPYARLFGADADTAYLQHTVSGAPMVYDGVDTVVLALGHESVTALEEELAALDVELHLAGDCLSPRSVEEAVYEGMMAGLAV
jgi:2,4-dienoyl-CoA reductase-like NADH-dependent reductase (Old Yellow Enzyme family)